MKILIFGATGFIGKELISHLQKQFSINVISRDYQKAKNLFLNSTNIIEWDYEDINQLSEILCDIDVVINLAGENIASKLWTKNQKQKIISSRLKIGRLITEAIAKAKKRPKLLMQSSAIGYYGYMTPDKCDESSSNGKGFLAEVTSQWEKSTEGVVKLGVQRVIIRTGVVLGNSGGMFPQIVKPIKLFLGTNLGNGKNIISWIHIKDEINAIEYLINHTEAKGIYNLVAPKPVSSMQLNNAVSKNLKRPIWLRIPRFLILLLLGEMGKELLLSSQLVIPHKLQQEGFVFRYNDIDDAVKSLIKEKAV